MMPKRTAVEEDVPEEEAYAVEPYADAEGEPPSRDDASAGVRSGKAAAPRRVVSGGRVGKPTAATFQYKRVDYYTDKVRHAAAQIAMDGGTVLTKADGTTRTNAQIAALLATRGQLEGARVVKSVTPP